MKCWDADRGQESPGFKRLLAVPAEVYPHFEQLLAKRKLTLIELYREPSRHADVFQVAEALIDFDLRLQEWRNRHILMVYRTIGVGTPSLKGKHSEMLGGAFASSFSEAVGSPRRAIRRMDGQKSVGRRLFTDRDRSARARPVETHCRRERPNRPSQNQSRRHARANLRFR